MIKLSELDASRVEHVRSFWARLHAASRRDCEPAYTLGQIQASCGSVIEVIDRRSGWSGTS